MKRRNKKGEFLTCGICYPVKNLLVWEACLRYKLNCQQPTPETTVQFKKCIYLKMNSTSSECGSSLLTMEDCNGEVVFLNQWKHKFEKTIWEILYPLWANTYFRFDKKHKIEFEILTCPPNNQFRTFTDSCTKKLQKIGKSYSD